MKKKLKGMQDLVKFIVIYSKGPIDKCAFARVVVVISDKWKHKLYLYNWINRRIIIARLQAERGYLTLVYVHTSQKDRQNKPVLQRCARNYRQYKQNQL